MDTHIFLSNFNKLIQSHTYWGKFGNFVELFISFVHLFVKCKMPPLGNASRHHSSLAGECLKASFALNGFGLLISTKEHCRSLFHRIQ